MEYIKKIDLLSKAVEVEYLGRPRMMVSVAQIGQMPSVDFEPKRGVWIGEGDGYADGEFVYDVWSCSNCGTYFEEWEYEPTWNFCPNCGARMVKDEQIHRR